MVWRERPMIAMLAMSSTALRLHALPALFLAAFALLGAGCAVTGPYPGGTSETLLMHPVADDPVLRDAGRGAAAVSVRDWLPPGDAAPQTVVLAAARVQ